MRRVFRHLLFGALALPLKRSKLRFGLAALALQISILPAIGGNRANYEAAPSWVSVELLPSAADRNIVRLELDEIYFCNDVEKAWESFCHEATGALVPISGGSNLLLVRYPQAASCELD